MNSPLELFFAKKTAVAIAEMLTAPLTEATVDVTQLGTCCWKLMICAG